MPTWRTANSGDDTGTACVNATFRSGNNAIGGFWEYGVNGQSGNAIAKQYAWGRSGTQLNGTANVAFSAAAGGGANSITFEIGTGGTISYGYQTYGNIQKVGFYVSVDGLQSSETIEWQSLTVTFYDANNTSSVLNVTSNLPSANYPSGSIGGSGIAVPDSGFTATRVVISGSVFLNASVATPGQNALVGNIYIWTDSCSAT